MKKLLLRIAIALGLIITIVYVLAHVYLWANESAMIFVGADLSSKDRPTMNDEVSRQLEEIWVETEDGVSLLLLESPRAGAPEAPWIIYFYGQSGRLADAKGIAMYNLFRRVGLNMLAVEYRGYGASEKAQPNEAGVYADARAAWRHLNQVRGVPANRVIVYGYSLGGGVAIQLATEMSPAGLVTENAFTSAPEMARMAYPWITTVAMRNRFENFEKAMSLSAPWLIFHGRRDERVPFEHAELLAGTTAGMRRLIPLECGHDNAIELEGDRMERVLKEFSGELFGLDHGRGSPKSKAR